MLLNSILLEGSLLDTPVYTPASPESSSTADVPGSSIDRCSFTLDCGPKAPTVPIRAYNLLAHRCSELLDRGSTVRVVGYIIHDVDTTALTGSFTLAVVCEHIEVKPSSRRSPALAVASDSDGF